MKLMNDRGVQLQIKSPSSLVNEEETAVKKGTEKVWWSFKTADWKDLKI